MTAIAPNSMEVKMAAPKGKIPEHVQLKQKKHCDPRVNHPLLIIFSEIEDPRRPSLSFKYPLISILFMTLVAVICGATDWAKVVVMSKGMADWLAQYVDMTEGIPCERTFTNIFNVIKPEALENANWTSFSNVGWLPFTGKT